MGFKRHHLKTHANNSQSLNAPLKTHTYSNNKTARCIQNGPKPLKTHVYSSINLAKTARENTENFPPEALALRSHPSRTRTASPRPHARTNRNQNRNRFPGSGGRTSRTSTPKPPIYIYIYIYICGSVRFISLSNSIKLLRETQP